MFRAEDFRNRLRQNPFVPFRIVTTTNQTYDINHPELVFITSNFLYVGLPGRRNPMIPDKVSTVALIHITEIHDLPQPAPAEATGTSES